VARKPIGGVSGVLGELISEPESTSTTNPPSPQSNLCPSAACPEQRPTSEKSRARLGRPPGRKPRTNPPKEKVTVRIDERLIALYREWSWEQRCQLGELFERALREYYRRKA